MAVNVEKKLISILKNSSFSMQLDESTIEDNNALLMANVNYFEENTLRGKMLLAINPITDARRLSTFNTVKSYFTRNNIPMNNIVAYASDGAQSMINDVNLQLQGANKTLIRSQSILSLFIDQLELLHCNLLKREFHQFPKLSSIKDDVIPEDIDRFSSHLNELKLDMEKRFEDILKLKVYDWMKNPSTTNTEEADTTYQKKLLEIRYDEESKHKFESSGYENL
ncbi:uncharacterized protein LOC142321223 [Lycorma delicatula]|uniref:uncharacterized protein LOC142321223 n=1 Tax=Lycorma delicatula TaxID=130591 RepID=UPI003F50D762